MKNATTAPTRLATAVTTQAIATEPQGRPGRIAAITTAAIMLSPSDFLSITTRRLRM